MRERPFQNRFAYAGRLANSMTLLTTAPPETGGGIMRGQRRHCSKTRDMFFEASLSIWRGADSDVAFGSAAEE